MCYIYVDINIYTDAMANIRTESIIYVYYYTQNVVVGFSEWGL